MRANSECGFLHDADARNDERMLELRRRHGWEAIGIFWALVEMMRQSRELQLSAKTLEAVSLGLGVQHSVLVEIVGSCCNVGLFELKGEFFFSPTLRRRMAAYRETVETRRRAANIRWAKSRGEQVRADEAQPTTSATAFDLLFPRHLQTSEAKALWAKWVRFKSEKLNRPYRTVESQNVILRQFHSFAHMKATIEASVRAEWYRLFPQKYDARGNEIGSRAQAEPPRNRADLKPVRAPRAPGAPQKAGELLTKFTTEKKETA